ncbi:VWA domain-containing protein [Nocardioides panacisoli]|uniref:VWA domain-containing protein n=1 Tax=Nocardioides panacisoli TaxID=627624 RepID=UPI001C629CAD|nr:VWA domain-containing protein [Nocardioides panacisoli]QYJ05469.1 VWA domain-containing protein [Nocardioides panacisoli]
MTTAPSAPTHFPFSAVVGADGPDGPDPMALALILTTISPEVGGVLVRGEKGTAKSTIVRALAAVLPSVDGSQVPLVELPVGATEDRVVGSIDLESALTAGKAQYQPGLLAKAHRGLLYVDEVNLLHDHLVDLLLDAAAMGRCTVERDGISMSHDAKFVLVGTMNPEEGELRPQLLDRFGLTVEVAAPRDPAARVEVIRRRIAYDADPDGFAAQYADAEKRLTERIREAQYAVGRVRLTDAALLKIAEVCAAFEVDGLRADIVTARAATAHAAWHGRDHVTLDDIRVAARLTLPHRRRRNPFDAPGLDEDLLDQVLGDDLPPEPPEPPEGDPDTDPPQGTEDASDQDGPDGEHGPGDPTPSPGRGEDGSGDDGSAEDSSDSPEPASDEADGADGADEAEQPAAPPGAGASEDPGTTVAPGTPYRTRLFAVRGTGAGSAGRRSRARTETGRRVGAEPLTGSGGPLHLIETVRAAAGHQHRRGRTGGRLMLQREDLRRAVLEGRESNLVLFCVDASGSMAARRRMEQVKTAVLSLLLDAYQRRDKVGLVTFRQDHAALALPPTNSVDAAAARLADLPAGGRTPLAEGLLEAAAVLETERIRDPRRRPLLVVVTDGRATAGNDPVVRSRQVADHLARQGVASLVVDCESGPMRLGLARRLAEHLQAEYVGMGEVTATQLVDLAKGAA